MKESKRRSDCPINFGLEIFGDRWTLLIIRDLMFKGKHYYGEFTQSEEKIATNLLADRLLMLENAGIVFKSKDEKHKQRIIYRLTKKGVDLMPILAEIIVWSAKYDKNSAVDRNFIKAVKKDRGGFLKMLSGKLLHP